MSYTILKDFGFAAAHYIPDHPGKCRHLHGHNYRARVYLTAEKLDELGMVIDFAAIKSHLNEIAGRFDHRVINEVPPFDQQNPTAELLSQHIYQSLAERLDDERVKVSRVEVWENDSCCAIFEP